MTGKRQNQNTPRVTESAARRARLEQELRANLLKRKAQAKARAKEAPEKDRDEGRQS
jgi:hypothetical protein